ncbi:Dps family protein [Moheibacter lacus]|uniref:DNA starvation/stationary phase protection protein n=1 Tax=Moheibacter lacus TaxID=2745851 RepID=A0A838ZSF3_9FLAO|nr:Dps family protein [Moheibacter lacus]MBA5629689.1 DNA starvation/stationary phase protection protein [Moheibacter lacus]
MKVSTIGLKNSTSKELSEDLNVLLANLQVYYQNLRGVHWNIKGEQFFQLHPKFEELYLDAQEKVDLVAERILTLGATPLHTFEDYVAKSSVKVGKNVSETEKSVQLVLDSIQELLKIERQILDRSAELDDEGTNSMMSDFISFQEKTAWMLNAFLGGK